jgi:copper chaperone NosL
MKMNPPRCLGAAWPVLPVLLFMALSAGAQATRPSAKDKCPVCGMFVAGYGNFLAEIAFQDGSRAYFDGPKDMFRYYFEPGKYHPGQTAVDITAVYVTDYYSLEMIDAKQAFYVAGSDVLGPMGNELIPVGREPEARTFLSDHKGKSLLKFGEVTLEIVNGLD